MTKSYHRTETGAGTAMVRGSVTLHDCHRSQAMSRLNIPMTKSRECLYLLLHSIYIHFHSPWGMRMGNPHFQSNHTSWRANPSSQGTVEGYAMLSQGPCSTDRGIYRGFQLPFVTSSFHADSHSHANIVIFLSWKIQWKATQEDKEYNSFK